MSIRAWIIGLVLACILPAWLAAGFLGFMSYERSRERIEQQIVTASHSLLLVVDGSLTSIQGMLQVLATSPTLEHDDLAAFRVQADQVLRQSPGLNIVLVDPEAGGQVVNTLEPMGTVLPKIVQTDWINSIIQSAKPSLSGLFVGAITKRPQLVMAVPVIRDGRVRYILTMALDANHIARILERQGMPAEWPSIILDRNGLVVADSLHPDEFVGHKAPPGLAQIAPDSPSGLVHLTALDGTPMLAAYNRSEAFNLTMSVGIPIALLNADLLRSLWFNVIGIIVFLLVGLLIAGRIGQGLSRPILSLIPPALALGRGALETIPRLSLKEADMVGQALLEAQKLITKRSTERDLAERAAMTDGLTGLANRRHFDDRLDTELHRLRRSSLPLTLILLDVDCFKTFNDTYGHLAGDACLRQVAATIAELLHRPSDLAARYGGEEFACILAEVDVNGAASVAESIRAAIARLHIPHAASTVTDHVTASLGVATVVPSLDLTAEQMIAMADLALYRAKESGRNCVRVAGDHPASVRERISDENA